MPDADRLLRLENALEESRTTTFDYTERDCILYALSLGFTAQDLDVVYEGSNSFHAFPTLGVLTGFVAGARPELASLLPNFHPVGASHSFLSIEKRAGQPITDGSA